MTKQSAKPPKSRTAPLALQGASAHSAQPVRLRTTEERFSDILREHERALVALGAESGPKLSPLPFVARPAAGRKATPRQSLRSSTSSFHDKGSFISSLPSSLQALVAASRRVPACLTAAAQVRPDTARNVKNPVRIEGTSLGESYQSLTWCQHVRGYAKESGRAARGRTYLINGAVTDLALAPGVIEAEVQGEETYRVTIHVDPLSETAWEHLAQQCTRSFDASVELLQHRMPDAVVKRLCHSDGLFPHIGELDIQCTCPDYAPVCKHVIAVLYAVGVRADANLEVLFTLRSATSAALHACAKTHLTAPAAPAGTVGPLSDAPAQRSRLISTVANLSALFGIELAQ